jgi:hypothetical protein
LVSCLDDSLFWVRHDRACHTIPYDTHRSEQGFSVVRGVEPEVDHDVVVNKSQRFAGQRELLHILTERNPRREGLTAKAAANILFAIGSPETYRPLVADRGWPADRFQRWYSDTLARLLLA